MKSVRHFIKYAFLLFILLSGSSYNATAQIELERMDDLRAGIVRLRQACLDSLHHSLVYLREMRSTIENADIKEEEKKGLLFYYLGDGHPRMLEYYNKYPDTKPKAGNLGQQKFNRLELLKLKQTWPKYILNTLAEYGQLEKEYPHNITGSNYFYGLFSFFDFENGDKIAVVGDKSKESLFALMLGLYLENTDIYIYKKNPYDLTRFFQDRLQNLTAVGTNYKHMERQSPQAVNSEKNNFLIVDLFRLTDRKALFSFAYHSLLPNGELCIIETAKSNIKNNIENDLLLSAPRIKKMAKRAGFRLVAEENLKVLKLYRFVKR